MYLNYLIRVQSNVISRPRGGPYLLTQPWNLHTLFLAAIPEELRISAVAHQSCRESHLSYLILFLIVLVTSPTLAQL